MPKASNQDRHNQRGTEWVTVHTDLDHGLAELLRGSGARGARHEKLVHQLSLAADPHQGKANNTVRYLPHDAAAVAPDVEHLLRKARAEGHPAAGKLADIAAQLGVTEAEPEPAAPPAA